MKKLQFSKKNKDDKNIILDWFVDSNYNLQSDFNEVDFLYNIEKRERLLNYFSPAFMAYADDLLELIDSFKYIFEKPNIYELIKKIELNSEKYLLFAENCKKELELFINKPIMSADEWFFNSIMFRPIDENLDYPDSSLKAETSGLSVEFVNAKDIYRLYWLIGDNQKSKTITKEEAKLFKAWETRQYHIYNNIDDENAVLNAERIIGSQHSSGVFDYFTECLGYSLPSLNTNECYIKIDLSKHNKTLVKDFSKQLTSYRRATQIRSVIEKKSKFTTYIHQAKKLKIFQHFDILVWGLANGYTVSTYLLSDILFNSDMNKFHESRDKVHEMFSKDYILKFREELYLESQ